MTLADATRLFLASTHDTYANHSVYLCAQTLGVLFRRGGPGLSSSSASYSYPGSPDDSSESYVGRWNCLFEAVEQWYENRPSQMKSIFSVSTATAADWGRERPFPTVLYANGAASKFLLSSFLLTVTSSWVGYDMLTVMASVSCSIREPALPYLRSITAAAQTKDAFSCAATGIITPSNP